MAEGNPIPTAEIQLPPEITRGKEIDLSGQVAIVTGSTDGIGRAIALKLGYHGACVVLNSRDNPATEDSQSSSDRADEILGYLEQFGTRGVWVPGDISDPNTAGTIAERTMEEFGRTDILVNNAGTTRDGLFLRMPLDDWDTVLNTKLRGAFLMSRAVIEQMMKKQRSGSIVNISSIAGQVGSAGQVNYSAANRGLDGFTAALAAEVAARDVRVNGVRPSVITTRLTKDLTESQLQRILDMQPLKGRVVTEDVAEMVLWLVSDRARMVTGQVFNIDGGTVRG